MNKSDKRTDKEIISAIEELIDEALTPQTPEEAIEIIENAGIDRDKYLVKASSLVKEALDKSPYNWRTKNTTQIEEYRKRLNAISVPDLPKNKLEKLINQLVEQLQIGGIKNVPVKLFRNKDVLSNEDLQLSIKQLLFTARENKIDISIEDLEE